MRRVLGHGTRYREEKSPAPIRIVGIRPRGVVDIMTPADVDPELVDMPVSLTVVYTPVGKVPENANVSAESLLASGSLSATVDVPKGGGNVTARVSGVKPAEYDVQLIQNFADDQPPPPPVEPPAPPPVETPPPPVEPPAPPAA